MCSFLKQIDYSTDTSGLHLWLAAISANGPQLFDLFPPLLQCPDLLDAGWSGARYMPFAYAAKAAWPFLSDQDRDAIETTVLCSSIEIDEAKKFMKMISPGQPNAAPIFDALRGVALRIQDLLNG